MTKEKLHILYDGLDNTQKEEVEKIFQRRRDQLYEWHDAERVKVDKKLKEDGRYKEGLDTNNSEPEVRELSAEYKRRFNSLPEECICELLGIEAVEDMTKSQADIEALKIFDEHIRESDKIMKKAKEEGKWLSGLDANNGLFKELKERTRERLQELAGQVEN